MSTQKEVLVCVMDLTPRKVCTAVVPSVSFSDIGNDVSSCESGSGAGGVNLTVQQWLSCCGDPWTSSCSGGGGSCSLLGVEHLSSLLLAAASTWLQWAFFFFWSSLQVCANWGPGSEQSFCCHMIGSGSGLQGPLSHPAASQGDVPGSLQCCDHYATVGL